jgi:hypothetical protein
MQTLKAFYNNAQGSVEQAEPWVDGNQEVKP